MKEEAKCCYYNPDCPICPKKKSRKEELKPLIKYAILLFGVGLPWVLLISLLTNALCD